MACGRIRAISERTGLRPSCIGSVSGCPRDESSSAFDSRATGQTPLSLRRRSRRAGSSHLKSRGKSAHTADPARCGSTVNGGSVEKMLCVTGAEALRTRRVLSAFPVLNLARSHAPPDSRRCKKTEPANAMLTGFISVLVPRKGLEPPRCYSLVPETSASTNSATWAFQEGLDSI